MKIGFGRSVSGRNVSATRPLRLSNYSMEGNGHVERQKPRRSRQTGQDASSTRRSRFFSEFRFLSASRRSFAARPGFVARRVFGRTRACRTRAANRSSAAIRFCLWLRRSLATTRSIPSESRRAASLARSLSRCSSSIAVDRRKSHSSSILVDDVLTCCPPAPPARVARKDSSFRGMASRGVTVRYAEASIVAVSRRRVGPSFKRPPL